MWLLTYPSVRATVLNPSGTFQYFVPLMLPMVAVEVGGGKREGVAVFYRIADPAALKVIAVLAEIFCPPLP